MKQNVAPKNKKINEFTREELLGEFKFSLGDSEIVVKRVLDFLIKLVMNKIQVNYVESLTNDYVVAKTFKLFRGLVDLHTTTMVPDFDGYSDKDKLEINLIKPKVDAMAFNKTKIVQKLPETHQIENSNPILAALNSVKSSAPTGVRNSISISSIALVNKIAKQFKKMETKTENLTKEERELKNGLTVNSERNSASKTPNMLSKVKNKIPPKENPKFISKYSIAVKENEEDEDIPMESFPIPGMEANEEAEDEFLAAKEKGFRVYFQQKEEREVRLKLQREAEEKNKEEEKRKRKHLEEIGKRYISYDAEGKLLHVKPPEIVIKPAVVNSKVRDFKEDEEEDIEETSDTKNKFNKKKIKEKKHKKSEEKIINVDDNDVQSMMKKMAIVFETEESKKLAPTLAKCYQPDPIVSHEIPAGVTLVSYGVKKSGGSFPKIETKISKEEFMSMLKKYKPQVNLPVSSAFNLNCIEEKYPENMSSHKKSSLKLSQAPEIDLLKEIRENDDNNLNNINNLKKSMHDQKLNPIINKFQPSKSKTNELHELLDLPSKVKTYKNFKIDDITPHESHKSSIVEYVEKPKDILKTEVNKSPIIYKDKHGNVVREMGNLKKYPRDRFSKDVIDKKMKIK